MKKRILSLLLLLCLLITGIPFAAVATETSEPQAEESSEVRTEYHDLYVKKGLVGLFTAFVGDAGVSLSDGKGTWSNRVEKGASATFAGTTGWRFGTMGGVGYDLVRGQVNAEGAYSTTYSGDTFNNNNKLQLSLDLLPKDDFTLEYLASYTMLYVYDERVGNLVYALDAGVTSAQLKDSGYNYIIGNPVDVIGFMCSYTTYRGHSLDDVPGKMRWRSVDAGGYKKFDNDYGMGGYDFANRTTSDIATYALTRDESVTGAGETLVTKATYVHLRNFTSEKTISVTSETTYGSGRYFNKDDDTDFYLSDRLGTTFYALRVYDRVLDDSEMKHNRAVDALNFYAIEISEEKLSDENIMASIYSSMAGVALLSDASAYTAKKAELQETVDKITGKLLDVNKLYVQKGLVGLFTAFKGDTTVSLTNGVGTWTNRVSGGSSASFAGTAGWSMGKLGGVGFTVVRGQIAEDGTFMASYEGNTYDNNNKLVFDLSFLPKEDFTLEYVASYLPHYLYDAKTDAIVEAYKTGNDKATTPNNVPSQPVDVIGFMVSYSTHPGNIFEGVYAKVRWRTADKAGYKTSWSDGAYGTSNAYDTNFRDSTAISTYALTRDENATGEGESLVTTAKYVHYLNRTAMKTINASSATTQGTGRYFNYDDDTEFYLSYHLGTTFYALRLYERVLTDAEMKHNRAVDVINFYDVELPEELHSNENLLARFLDALDGISFESDATAYAAVQANIQTIIDRLLLKFTDLHQFYVKDGLVSLFTTFGDYADSVDLANGTWTDIVAGNKATFKYGGKNTWKQNANGSVGFTVFRGAMIDGAVSSNSSSTDTYRNVNNRLQFGIELLPESDFTVEYLAMYKPLYVYDASASDNIARDENGSKRETYNEGIEVGLHVTYEIDELGWFSSRASLLDTTKHYWSPNANAAYADRTDVLQRGSVHWFYNCHYWSYNPVTGDSRYNNQYYVGSLGSHAPSSGLNNTKDAFQTNDVVRTYSISLDETLTVAADGKRTTTALFALYRNATLYNSNSSYLNTTERGEDAHGGYIDINTPYITQTSDTSSRTHDFWLSSTRATDFFGVRVYEKALTDAERRQNYAVDVMLYYGIDIPLALANDAAAMNRLAIGLARETLETDASAYAAARLRIQAYVTAETVTEDLTELYAAKENLTALFTTFYPETVDLASGTWTDIVSGKTAKFEASTCWSVSADGAVGFDIFHGTLDANGTYNSSSTGNNSSTNARLNFGIALLPTEDFTVEYMAMYKPVYLYDANTVDHILRDKDGNKLETFDYNNCTTGLFVHKLAVDNLGWFQGLASSIDGIIYEGWRYASGGGALTGQALLDTRGIIHWTFAMHNGDEGGWYLDSSGRQSWWLGKDGAQRAWGGLNIMGDVFQQNNIIRTYAISVDETVTAAGDTEAIFSLYRDAAFYNSNELQGEINTSAKGMADGGYIAGPYDSKCRFWLSANRPTDFYGVRIYNKDLTDAERIHNRAIDVALYYGISITSELIYDEQVGATVLGVLAGAEFAMDASEKAAVREELQAMINTVKEQVALVEEMKSLYAKGDHMTALFTVYAPGTLSLTAGTWTDFVGNNTAILGNRKYWHMNADGSIGYNIFYGTIGEDGAYTATSVYNNYSEVGTRLEFGIAALPKGDYTVEYVAGYHPVYLADAEGNIYTDKDGNKLETMSYVDNTPGNQQYGTNSVAPIDSLGFIQSWTTNRDGHFYQLTFIRGGIYWCYGDLAKRSDAWNSYNWSKTFFKTNEIFYQRDSIHSYAITRSKTTDATGLVTAKYALLRDAATYASGSMNNTTFVNHASNKNKYPLDFADDDTGYFYLAERLPVDFYGVRIYDVELTSADRARNRLIDLSYYYDVELPDFAKESDTILAQLANTVADLPFATDASAKAAAKAKLVAAVAELESMSATSTLYVQDGLVALYTAFAGEGQYLTASGNNMLWTNRVLGGQKAAFEKTGWTYNATLGGVGYDLIYGTVDTDKGTFSTTCSQDTYARGNRLNLGLDLLPKQDFTLEYVAYYSPVLSYDSATSALVDAYGTGITITMPAGQTEPVDTVGFLSSYTTQHGGLFYADYSTNTKLGLLRWRSMDKAGYKTWADNGYGWGGNLVTVNRASRTVETYAITRDETTTNDAVTAVYTHLLNGVLVDSDTYSSANATGANRYYTFEDDTEFYLSYKLGTTFYALRVYDRILTAEEQKQNRMADLIGYYGVMLPEDFFTNEERYEYVVSLCDELTFARDAVAYNANKRLLQTSVAGGGNTVTLIVDGKEEMNIIYGDNYLLPSAVEGKTIFAWQLLGEDGHTTYEPGAILTLSGDDTLRALVMTAPTTRNGVTVKAVGDNGFGMRFTAAVDKAEYLALVQEYGQDYIRMSMLITPKAYVDGAGGFTREKLTTYVNQKGGNVANSYVEILADGFYTIDEDVCTIAGTIYNFTEVTIAKKPAFAAIACIDVDTNKDGIVDKTVYGTYSSVTCRYPHQTIESLLYGDNNLTNTQREWVENFMKNYTDRTYGVAGVDKTVGEQRAEIEAAMNAALNTTVDYVVHEFAEGEVAAKYAHIKAISFDGLDSNGKKTRIFAYVGLPEGASAENPAPAMVLVHGGGGHAYMEWVRLWNERGYAAIAMETTGYFPATPGAWVTEGNAPTTKADARALPDFITELEGVNADDYTMVPLGPTSNRVTPNYAEVDEQWQYHGISSVILSHNVLRQIPGVDSDRIGTIGVSWGGTLVAQVIGYDTRYAFAIPVYGTAYISEPERPFIGAPYVYDLWAAERNLDNFKNPVMWFAWADDNNFVISSYNKSYLQSLKNNSESTFVLLADWRHSHSYTWNKEHGYAFADAICFPEKNGGVYAHFTSQPNGQDLTSTVALPAGATNVKVRLHYLTEPISYKTFEKYSGNYSYLAEYIKTDTKTATIDPATGKITGTAPAEMYYYYISVTYEVNGVSLETSSSFISVR